MLYIGLDEVAGKKDPQQVERPTGDLILELIASLRVNCHLQLFYFTGIITKP